MAQYRGRLSDEDLAIISYLLIDVLLYLEENNIHHRDISLNNILIGKDKSNGFSLKIIDFGLSSEGIGVSGIPFYIAPEIILGMIPSKNADLFSWGVCLYQLLYKTFPFPTDTENQYTVTFQQDNLSLSFGEEVPLPKSFQNFISSLPARSPRHRISTAELARAKLTDLLKLDYQHQISDDTSIKIKPKWMPQREKEFAVLKSKFDLCFKDHSPQKLTLFGIVSGETLIGKSQLLSDMTSYASLCEISVREFQIEKYILLRNRFSSFSVYMTLHLVDSHLFHTILLPRKPCHASTFSSNQFVFGKITISPFLLYI